MLLSAWLVAYLPGALLFRLPVAHRDRRAALDAGERAFWHVTLSVAWSLGLVLLLAALDLYRFERLLALNAGLSIALIVFVRHRLAYGGSAARPGPTLLVPLVLVGVGTWQFFPPGEYVIGGKDPGVYFNEGIQIAQRGSLVIADRTIAAVPVADRAQFFPLSGGHEYESGRFMGFFVQDVARGQVVGQFPHLFPASIAIGYGLDGLTGARRVVGWWTVLGLLAVYFAGAHLVGRPAAFAGALLLALSVITVFFSKYPNAEVAMLALLFAALLAVARADDGGDPFFAPVAGGLAGLLLFLRIDVALALVAILATMVLVALAERRLPRVGFFVALAPLAALAGWYYTGLMRAYLYYPAGFLQNLPPANVLAGSSLGLALLVALWRMGLRHRARVRRAVPIAVLTGLTVTAAYAYFFREPAGRLTDYDAHALRTFTNFYLQPLGLVAAIAGLWLVVRDRFWRAPALIVTFSAYALFFFYKIRIVPEHFWMTRRFLPVILPVALLMVAAAALGPRVGGRTVSMARRIVGVSVLVILGWQYAAASRPLGAHVEYAGLIPYLEALAARFGDRDLVLVESRDAGFDTHVFATPLAYIYARNVLELPNARPDKLQLRAFLDDAFDRYDRVWFLGGGGTDLLSRHIGAVPVFDERFSVPEYDSAWNAYPQGVDRKDFQYTVYELVLDPPFTAGFTLDIGERDDLNVVRFFAKERSDGRSVRWTQGRSAVAVAGLAGSETTLVLTMHDGGRPAGAEPARVTVVWDGTTIATIEVRPGFQDYTIPLPADLVRQAGSKTDPVELRLESTTWVPRDFLGSSDDRSLGVMLDRVEIREP